MLSTVKYFEILPKLNDMVLFWNLLLSNDKLLHH